MRVHCGAWRLLVEKGSGGRFIVADGRGHRGYLGKFQFLADLVFELNV